MCFRLVECVVVWFVMCFWLFRMCCWVLFKVCCWLLNVVLEVFKHVFGDWFNVSCCAFKHVFLFVVMFVWCLTCALGCVQHVFGVVLNMFVDCLMCFGCLFNVFLSCSMCVWVFKRVLGC